MLNPNQVWTDDTCAYEIQLAMLEYAQTLEQEAELSQEYRDASIAHEIVDERNEIYPRQWLINRPMPSGHDWTERDGEFLPPIHLIADGGELDNLWELDDEIQAKRETECNWCHILTPKQFNDCQACDRPLESNVR